MAFWLEPVETVSFQELTKFGMRSFMAVEGGDE